MNTRTSVLAPYGSTGAFQRPREKPALLDVDDPISVFFGTAVENIADNITFGAWNPNIISEQDEAAFRYASTAGSVSGQIVGFIGATMAASGVSSAIFASLAGVSKFARLARAGIRTVEVAGKLAPAASKMGSVLRGGTTMLRSINTFGLMEASRETVRQFKEKDFNLADAAERYALGALQGGIYGMMQGAFALEHPVYQALSGGAAIAAADAVTMAFDGEDIDPDDLAKSAMMGAALSLVGSRGWKERRLTHDKRAAMFSRESMEKMMTMDEIKKYFMTNARGWTTPAEAKNLEKILAKSESPRVKGIFSVQETPANAEKLHRIKQGLVKEAQRAAEITDDDWHKFVSDITQGRTATTKELTGQEFKDVYDDLIEYSRNEYQSKVMPNIHKMKDPGFLSPVTPIDKVLEKMGATDLMDDITRAKQWKDILQSKVSVAARANFEIFANDMKIGIKEKFGTWKRNEPGRAQETMFKLLEIEDANELATALSKLTQNQRDAVLELRKITDFFLARTNEARAAMGEELIIGRKGYMHHITTIANKVDERNWTDILSGAPGRVKKVGLGTPGKNVTAMERRANVEYLKDPVRAIETMANYDLKDILLHNPARALKAKMDLLYKTGTITQAQGQELNKYVDFAILGAPTARSTQWNKQLHDFIKSGKKGEMIEHVLAKFNRTVSERPLDDFSRAWGRAATGSMMLFRLSLAFRNIAGQMFFPLGLTDTKTYAKALGGWPKLAKEASKTSSIYQTSASPGNQGFEGGVAGRIAEGGGAAYQTGHNFVADLGFKAGWWQYIEHANLKPKMKNGKPNGLFWGTEKGYAMRQAAKKAGNKNWRQILDGDEIALATKNAERMLTDIEFLYHVTGMPSVFLNPLGRAAFKFQSYPMNYIMKYVPRMANQAMNGTVPWDATGKMKYSLQERAAILHHFVLTAGLFAMADKVFGLNYLDSIGIYYSPSEREQGRGFFGSGIEVGAFGVRPSMLPQMVMSLGDLMSPEPYIRKRAVRTLTKTGELMATGMVAPGGQFAFDVKRAVDERDPSIIVTRRERRKKTATPDIAAAFQRRPDRLKFKMADY